MKYLFIMLFITFFLSVSCSSDNDTESIEGVWKLTAWNVAGGFDINKDGVASINILDEIDCVNNETLHFETNGIVSSTASFNPEINIALLTGTTDEYVFDVVCDDAGVISFASSYSRSGDVVVINNRDALIDGNQIYQVFENAVEIHNEDLTQVVASKDLTLVYTKQ